MCDTSECLDFKSCEPCPDHAECEQGRFKCIGNFIEKNGECVENEEVKLQALKILDKF